MKENLIPVGVLAHYTMEGGTGEGGYLEEAVVGDADCFSHSSHSGPRHKWTSVSN